MIITKHSTFKHFAVRYNSPLGRWDFQIANFTLVLIGSFGSFDKLINDGVVLEMNVEMIAGGWIDFDGKSGPLCPGSPIS